MELKLDGCIKKEQYLLGTKLSLRAIPTSGNKLVFELWIFMMVVGIVSLIAGAGVWLSHNFIVSIILIVFGAVFIKLGFELKKLPEKAWKSIEGLHITGSVTEEGIELITSNGQSHFKWDDLSGFGAENDIVLLVPKGPNSAFIIPKQYFSNALSWQVFNHLVSERLPITHSLSQDKVPFEKTNPFLYILLGIVTLMLLIYSFFPK